MTDTGPVPGEGLPETAGAEAVHQPHADRPVDAGEPLAGPGPVWHPDGYHPAVNPGYTFLDQQEGTDLPGVAEDDDDLLLMPAPQGSWGGDPQPVPPQPAMVQAPVAAEVPAAVEAGGEAAAADAGAARAPEPATAPRRPLHLGPPVPEPTIGVAVRSLADRGPTPVPAAAPAGPPQADPVQPPPEPVPVQPQSESVQPQPEPVPVHPAAGPDYAEPPGEQPSIPGQQIAEAPVAGGPWAAAEPAAQAAPALALAVPEVATEPQPAPLVGEPPAQAAAPSAADPVAQPAAADPEPPIAARAAEPVAPETSFAAADPEHAAGGPQSRTDAFLAEQAPAQVLSGPPAVPVDQPAPETPRPQPAADAPAPDSAASPLPGQPETAEPQEAAVGAVVPEAAAQPVEETTDPAGAGQEPAAAAAVADPAGDTSPAEEQQAPADEEQAPAEEQQAPAAEEQAPAEEQQAPAAEEQAPAEEQQALVAAAADEQSASRTDGGARPAAGPPAPPYDDAVREAVHRVIRERRDIRNGFRPDPIPHDVLIRVLEAAHTAPSVGHSQPWDFVVIRSAATREKMHALAMKQREAYAASLPRARAKQFRELKIEAILDTPVNIVVTADPTRGGRHTLGRHTQPQMAPYSSALAVENLWLAARAEGLGVGWVSFFDEREMVRELGLPEHLEVVAYLCVGYVEEFPADPELMQAGWSKRRPLSWVVHEEEYGRRALPGEEPHDLLDETLGGIRPLDAKALGEAWERQKRMTKPAGALGMLEIISAQLCGLSRQCPPPIPEPAAVAIFAGDHGVHAQGVTAWPQEVTAQMVANFLAGGAVSNAFAGQVGCEVCVVDVGVAADLPTTPGLLPRKVRQGTGDFTVGPAMVREEALRAIEVGIETARDLVAAGNKALLTGEMGIANTTPSAALICVFTGADPAEVTGRGTGINDEMHARKVEVVRRALELHRPDQADPIGALAAVGGLEHAAMVGLILGGASLRTPVILDGVSAGAAALVARAIAPEALAACIAGHRSAEPGHVAALTKLGLRPLVDLDLRLGEGTGALLALPLVQSAARVMHEVATFDTAGVTEKR